MIPRPDLLDPNSPPGLEVFQLTTEADVPSSHIYMEAQIFTPDSKRFLLHRSAHPHGSDKGDPEHRYLLCDVEAGGTFLPVTDELGATAPSLSPDGAHFYYFVDETVVGGGWLTLKRRNIDGTHPEIITVIDSPLPGTSFRPSNIYPLSTIRSDGQKIALCSFLGDGETPGQWGLMVFDIPTATVNLVIHGPSWCNMHPQYSRSLDPVQMRDILLQENHGNTSRPDGTLITGVSPPGVDIHVLRDDGHNFRDMPWGRNGDEGNQGHQCWRGRSEWGITGTGVSSVEERQLIEGKAAAHLDHLGLNTPGAVRNDLSRNFDGPDFHHFATDIEGERLITDCGPSGVDASLYFAYLGEPGRDALRHATYLLKPRSTWINKSHVHPFLSPDGQTAYFNSDESGILQAYMLRGLPNF
jgi:hypothetical protein